MPTRTDEHDRELAGIDALDLPLLPAPNPVRRALDALWPKVVAAGLLVTGWQAIVWSGWKDPWQLPAPAAVFTRLLADLDDGLLRATAITMSRAVIGFAIACVIGAAVGLAVSRVPVLRDGVGSLITGIQTMPSIAWFPLAILLFQLSERAIGVVVVLGAAPSIANGIINGIDHIPPTLLNAGRVLGARGMSAYRHVVLPAAVPGAVAGLKQGWAFAWRSLMAGELLVIIASRPSLGARLQFAREFNDAEGLLAVMIVILVIGVVIDGLVFGRLERSIRARRGLLGSR